MILCFQLPPPLRTRGQNEGGGGESKRTNRRRRPRMPTEEGREELTDS